MNYLLIFLCIGIVGAQVPEVYGCNNLQLNHPDVPFFWVCAPKSTCKEINKIHSLGMRLTRCDTSDTMKICCPTLNYPPELSHFDITPTPTVPKMITIVMDTTCDSLRKKYEHFSWSCDYNTCDGVKILNLYYMEKAGCDVNDKTKICCPSQFHYITSPPPQEMDVNCSGINQKHNYRFKWTCARQPCSDKRLSDYITEKVQCDHEDTSKICCPASSSSENYTPHPSPPLTSTMNFKGVISTPITAQPEVARAPPPIIPRKSTPNSLVIVYDIECRRTRRKYNSINWTCEKCPCRNHTSYQQNDLLKGEKCDPKDQSKICCISNNKNNANQFPFASEVFGKSPNNGAADVKTTTHRIKPSVLHVLDPNSDELLHELKMKKFNKFDIELLSVLSKERHNKNIVVSPLSMKLLLALLMEGAVGKTANEILLALQLHMNNKSKGTNLMRKLQSVTLERSNPNITLESQNKIYIAPGVTLQQRYQNTITESYKTTVESLDFASPDAYNQINSWVNNVTHGLIPSLVEKEQIKETMKLFLVNYIYLKANWDIEFNRQLTHKGCFYTLKNPNECHDVWMMNKKRSVKYENSEQLDAQIVEIPFKDSRYVVTLMLPNEKGKVYELLEKLHRRDLHQLFEALEQTTVTVSIPRTTIDFSGDMAQTLQSPELKIVEVFRPTANLSQMLSNHLELGVSNVIHKARIEINEEGTKAVGASGGGVQVLSLTMDINVMFDHPFLFFVRDTRIAGFLFEGIVISPDKFDSAAEKANKV